MLLLAGADFNVRSKSGLIVLLFAEASNHVAVVRLLEKAEKGER